MQIKQTVASLLFMAGCATSQANSAATQVTTPSGHGPDDQSAVAEVVPVDLAMNAVRCWMGGVWGDAVGVPADERRADDRATCGDVVRSVYGVADPTRVEQLRAFEPSSLDDLVAKVGTASRKKDQGTASPAELVAFVRAVAAAEREGMWARRAADRIKIDIADERSPDKLNTDELAAAKALGATAQLRALLELKGRYAHDAHALGVIAATDRMELARGLPKHMKLYAVDGVNGLLFGAKVQPPPPATQPALPGVWLACLTEGARAAGHAVPASIHDTKLQKAAAWAGMLDGFADQLARDTDAVSPQLRPLVDGTLRRLRAEATNDRNYANGI